MCVEIYTIFVHGIASSFNNTEAHSFSVQSCSDVYIAELFATYTFKHAAIFVVSSITIESFVCCKRKRQNHLSVFVGIITIIFFRNKFSTNKKKLNSLHFFLTFSVLCCDAERLLDGCRYLK